MKFIGNNCKDAETLAQIIKQATYCDVQDYSGRGMYGKSCMSVTISKNELAEFFYQIGEYVGANDLSSPWNLMSYSLDNMGYDGLVLYWRCFEVEPEFDSETDEA